MRERASADTHIRHVGYGCRGPKYDFVPSQAAPAYFTTEHLVGAVAPGEFNGLQVLGSYGDARLIESHYVALGYVIVAATCGLDSDVNSSDRVSIRSVKQKTMRSLWWMVLVALHSDDVLPQRLGVGRSPPGTQDLADSAQHVTLRRVVQVGHRVVDRLVREAFSARGVSA